MAETIRESETVQKKAARIRAVLAFRSLSLHQISAASARIYGSNSPSHIPHTLYHALARSADFGPSLAQICALSRITGYRIEDWMAVFGIDLGRTAGIEAALPLKRTRLIEPLCDRVAPRTGVLAELAEPRPSEGAVPFGQMVKSSSDRRSCSIPKCFRHSHCPFCVLSRK